MFTLRQLEKADFDAYRGLQCLALLGNQKKTSAQHSSAIQFVRSVPGHIAVSFHGGSIFVVFDRVSAGKRLPEKDQETLTKFVVEHDLTNLLPRSMLARSCKSPLVDIKVLRTRQGLHLMAVQANSAVLIWRWVADSAQWKYLGRRLVQGPRQRSSAPGDRQENSLVRCEAIVLHNDSIMFMHVDKFSDRQVLWKTVMRISPNESSSINVVSRRKMYDTLDETLDDSGDVRHDKQPTIRSLLSSENGVVAIVEGTDEDGSRTTKVLYISSGSVYDVPFSKATANWVFSKNSSTQKIIGICQDDNSVLILDDRPRRPNFISLGTLKDEKGLHFDNKALDSHPELLWAWDRWLAVADKHNPGLDIYHVDQWTLGEHSDVLRREEKCMPPRDTGPCLGLWGCGSQSMGIWTSNAMLLLRPHDSICEVEALLENTGTEKCDEDDRTQIGSMALSRVVKFRLDALIDKVDQGKVLDPNLDWDLNIASNYLPTPLLALLLSERRECDELVLKRVEEYLSCQRDPAGQDLFQKEFAKCMVDYRDTLASLVARQHKNEDQGPQEIRQNPSDWTEDSPLEVYSKSMSTWYPGRVCNVERDILTVQYQHSDGKTVKTFEKRLSRKSDRLRAGSTKKLRRQAATESTDPDTMELDYWLSSDQREAIEFLEDTAGITGMSDGTFDGPMSNTSLSRLTQARSTGPTIFEALCRLYDIHNLSRRLRSLLYHVYSCDISTHQSSGVLSRARLMGLTNQKFPACYTVVMDSGAPVTMGHSRDSEQIAVLEHGTQVTVVEIRDTRARITNPYAGWCDVLDSTGYTVTKPFRWQSEAEEMFDMPYDHGEYVNMALGALVPMLSQTNQVFDDRMRERVETRVRLLCWRSKGRDISNAIHLLLSTPDRWGNAERAEKLCEKCMQSDNGAAIFTQIVDGWMTRGHELDWYRAREKFILLNRPPGYNMLHLLSQIQHRIHYDGTKSLSLDDVMFSDEKTDLEVASLNHLVGAHAINV